MENIIHAFESATNDQIAKGLSWYADARAWAVKVAEKYGYSTETIVRMIAVMSPRNRWEWNLHDVIGLLDAIAEGRNPELVPCHSFNRNKLLAIAIAKGNTDYIGGQKVSAFIDNICNPDSVRITVDVWAYRVYLGDYKMQPKKIPAKLYALIESEYLKCAEIYNLKGYELQAIVWAVARGTGNQFNESIPEI